jgi:GNAT superfamily N-acetyltransferase
MSAKNLIRCSCRILTRLCRIPAYLCHSIRARGIRGAMLRFGSELHSRQEYVVTRHDLNSRVEISPCDLQIEIAEVTRHQIQDIEEICRVWPSEFGCWRPEHLKLRCLRDLEDGNWCLCARSNGNVIGAIWVSKQDAILESCPVRHMPGERIVGRTFIVPHARGMGLSKLLYDHAVKIAVERGVPQLFGFTFPRRVASIKSKLSVGFEVIGTLQVTTRFGKNAYKFTPATESGLPTARPERLLN